MISTSFRFLPPTRVTCQPLLFRLKYNSESVHRSAYAPNTIRSCQISFGQYTFSRNKATLKVGCSGQGISSGEDDHRALETVLKLYNAIKSKNFSELSDIIGEECLCICNFVSSFKHFRGKQQVLAFFSSLMKSMGNNVEFVVQPMFQDGMSVGVSWKLEWKQTRVPLGKGFGFYICHVYQGKVTIKNMEMFLEPLVHIEPLRLTILTCLVTAMDIISSRAPFNSKTNAAKKILLIFVLVAALMYFLRYHL